MLSLGHLVVNVLLLLGRDVSIVDVLDHLHDVLDGREDLLQSLFIFLALREIQILLDVPEADLMYGFVEQDLLGFVLLAQLFAESEELLDRGVVLLLHHIDCYEVVNVLDQKLARVRKVSQRLHELLGAGDLLEIHDNEFEFDLLVAVLDEFRHDVDDLLQEVLNLLLLPLLRQDRNEPQGILLGQVLEVWIHLTNLAQEVLQVGIFECL